MEFCSVSLLESRFSKDQEENVRYYYYGPYMFCGLEWIELAQDRMK
jgi:hypothetical protein